MTLKEKRETAPASARGVRRRHLLSSSAACLRLLDALPTGVLLVGADERVLHANETAGALLGRMAADLEGQPLGALLAPLDTLPRDGERGRVAGGGAGRWLGCRLARVEELCVEGKQARYLVIFEDETSWAEVASERDQLLRLAAVGEVLPAVLHELKNPLAAVTTSVEVLLEEVDEGSSVQTDLQAIVGELRRMRLTLEGASTMGARLRSGRLQAVDRAVREACQVLDKVAAAAGVTLGCEVDALPPLGLDAGVLRSIVFNLVQNAVQACVPGGQVRVRARLAAPGVVELCVSDDGCGMTTEVQARCRDLFFTTKKRGTGIGLSLCHRIVSDAGGELALRSAPGQGTEIRLRLPT